MAPMEIRRTLPLGRVTLRTIFIFFALVGAIVLSTRTQSLAATVHGPTNGPLVIEGASPGKSGRASLYSVGVNAPTHLLGTASYGNGYFISGAPSPRGRFIALAEQLGGLWIVNASGSSPYQLVGGDPHHGVAVDVTAVAWSPDRYTIAYMRDTRNMGCGCGAPTVDTMTGDGLWTVRYDGTKKPQLIMSATTMGVGGPFGLLSWTPDGTAVYANTPRGLEKIAIPSGSRRLIVPRVAGVVSPDGTSVAVISRPTRYDPHFVSTLSVRNIATGSTTVLARTTMPLGQPRWSPDGRFLAYTKGLPGNFPNNPVEVHIINVSSRAISTVYRQPHSYPIGIVAWLPSAQ